MRNFLKTISIALVAASALFTLSLLYPPARHAYAAGIDYALTKVGAAPTLDTTGAQIALQIGVYDGTVARAAFTGSASGQGNANTSTVGLMVSPAADLSVNSTPAVNTQASATTASAGTTARNIGTGCSGSINTVAAQTPLTLSLRDGATGAGTVLWSVVVGGCAITTGCTFSSPPLNAVGSANTAMTCEWSGIPAVGNFEVANLQFKRAL